jgi:cold shock CspA family protein
MAEKVGWEVLVCWQQIMPYVFLEADESLDDFLVHILKLEKSVVQKLKEKLSAEFQLHRGLKLSAQLYIWRKK